jgi:hypothetical protein
MDNATPSVVASPKEKLAAMVPMGQEEAPQATPETQTSGENTQPVEAPKGQATEGEFQMPDKFKGKSAEEIAQSYVALEKHKTKVEMERAELEKLFVPQSVEEQTQSEPTQQTQEDPMKDVMTALGPKLREEFSRLITPVVAKFEVKDVLDKYGERFSSKAQEVARIKKEKPSLSLEEAFKIADYGSVERTSYNQGAVEASTVNEQKGRAIVESSKPSGYRSSSIEDAVKNPEVPVADIAEAMGPEWKRFAEISKKKQSQGNH